MEKEEKRDKIKQIEWFYELRDACKKNFPHFDEEMLAKAFSLAEKAHINQKRDSGEPYIMHPYSVAMIIVNEIPLDDISVYSALLHDVVEDTEFTLDFIEKQFGKEVAEIVDGVTKMSGVFKGQEITQAENYRKLLLSMVKDVRVILVKFADRLHNMRTLDFVRPEKQRRIAKETLEIYAPFANRFGLGKVKWELEDLSFKFLNKEAYNEIAKRLKEKRNERENYINSFIVPIKQKLEEANLKFSIGGRPKHIYSIYKKMIKQNTVFDNIFDLLAIRVILEDPHKANECFLVLGIINQMYKPIPDRFKDYISIPKKNNYQSIHNTVIGPEGKLVEIQIRTRSMHEIAEKGVAAHWRYKENITKADKELEDWVNWIRDVFENANKNEASEQIMQSFSLNLYQDEIYVFTPKGDLRRLPTESTPVDFAFDIHSNVGSQCIGAKVNGKIVPLSTKLHSGDQVDIITSKNQHPNKNWLQFVVTHKAKAHIRKHINKEQERLVEAGKEIWDKKLKKLKLVFDSEDIQKLSRKLKYDNNQQFFLAISENKVDLDKILSPETNDGDEGTGDFEFNDFVEYVRTDSGGVLIEGDFKGLDVSYAKCCHPIPGDPIVGYITIGEGVKIHRKDCPNVINMSRHGTERFVKAAWPGGEDSVFMAGIKISGEDSPGILKELSNSITNYRNTNIKAINISSNDNMFTGSITVYVTGLQHLKSLIERLKKLKYIYYAERYDSDS